MKKSFIALGLIAAAGTFATVSDGFVILNPGRKWFQGLNGGPNDLPVLYRVNSGGESSVNDGDNGVTAVRNSLTAWNSHVSGNIFWTTTTSSNAIGNDGQNVVSFNDPGRIVRNAIAVTLVGYYNSSQIETVNGIQFRRYLDADISFSNKLSFTTQAVGNCSGQYDIVGTGTHEGGHALGLDHSAASSALMYPSIGACQFKGIATDDHNGVNTIYTPGFGGGGGCTATEARLGSLSCSAPNNGPNCLVVSASVVDNCGDGVGGASVTVQLAGNTGDVLTGTASTNASGAVSFGLRCNNVASTSYTVTVTNISSSPAWDSNDAANAPNPIVCVPR
jgi:hypothetical protein